MSSSRIRLETFEDGSRSETVEGADYTRGFADGTKYAAGMDTAKRTQSLAEVSSSLNDMAFGYEEAKLHVFQRLDSILVQIGNAILPQIAKDTFSAHLTDLVKAEFQTASDEPIQISVAPDLVETLNEAHDVERFLIVPDTSLNHGQALICQSNTHILLDLPALAIALQTALSGLELTERTEKNGS